MNRKAWQKTVLDKDVTIRFKKLGDLGEYLAGMVLAKAGFRQIVNLNKERKNTKYFDLTARRGRQSFAISVKARNRFENSVAGKKLNSRYKLTDDPAIFESEAREKYRSMPAWIAIPFYIEQGTFDAYFGQLQDLKGNRKGIVINAKAIKMYEVLAKQKKFDGMDISKREVQQLKNRYTRR